MAAKKKITKMQKFALNCYIKSLKSVFKTEYTYKKLKKDIAAAKYEDEFDAIKGYMLAKAQDEYTKQIIAFFKALLDALI